MKIDKYIKKDIIMAAAFIIIGIVAAITGFVFHYQVGVMTGITAGFLPTGILMIIIYQFAKKKPKMQKNIEIENEERNIFINTKAGSMAFWITYWYIFAVWVLSYIIKITILPFIITTIVFMPVVYFVMVILLHRKY